MIPLLINELETADRDTFESEIITAVGMIGKPANAATPAIERFLTDQDVFNRRAAKKVLIDISID